MLKKYSWILILVASLLSSCKNETGSGPNSTGKGSEILVVCDKVQWDGLIGNTIRKALTGDMEGLPESEPEYTLINVPYNSFSQFLRSHRNVLIVEVTPGLKNPGIETQQNTWSHPQRVIKITAGSDTAFMTVFRKYQASIKELYNRNERARFGAQNALSRNIKVEAMLEKDFGIKMIISSDFYLAKKASDFVWLRKETNEMSLGLIIYTYPYTDTNQMKPSFIQLKRNEYTRANIPGPADGSYMIVADEVLKPVTTKVKFNGYYATETRGLWETHGDFMGGPFVNYCVVDTTRQRIVAFDGYVYYPNKSKRNYIRQMESIIWGASFTKPNSGPAKATTAGSR